MSKDNLSKQNNNDEVDLGVLFTTLGNILNSFYKFLISVFKLVFSLIILPLKAFIKNFKIVFGLLVLAVILGFVADKFKTKSYQSKMIVEPFFESKYAVVNNVNYFNSLISDKNNTRLMEIFDISEEYAQSIIKFEISNGPETENDKLVDYDKFVTNIDSTRIKDLPFKNFIKNRDIYSYNTYEIKVISSKKEGFSSLEKGLRNSFVSPYVVANKRKQDSILNVNKSGVLNSLRRIDSLQSIYSKVLKEKNTSNNVAGFTAKDGFVLQESTKTYEIELVNKEIELRKQLLNIEVELINNSSYFEILSSLQNVGSVNQSLYSNFKVGFPLLMLLLLTIFFYAKKVVTFIVQY